MANRIYGNFGETDLNGSITSTATSVVVTDGSVLPQPAGTMFVITVDDEIMEVTARSTNTLTVTRGAEGTTPATHTDGTAVRHTLTRDSVHGSAGDPVDAAHIDDLTGWTITSTQTSPALGEWGTDAGHSWSVYTNYLSSHWDGGTAGVSSYFDFYRGGAGGGTVANDYVLHEWEFYGRDGTGSVAGADIKVRIDGTVATNQMPTEIVFSTNGGTSVWSERWRISPDGHLEPLTAGTPSTGYDIGEWDTRVRNLYIGDFIGLITDSNTAVNNIEFYRNRASNTIVADNDWLGYIGFYGNDGAEGGVMGARIAAAVDGTPANDNVPTELLFATVNAGTSPTDRWRISPAGNLEPMADSTYNIGSDTMRANDLYVGDIDTESTLMWMHSTVNRPAISFERESGSTADSETMRLAAFGNGYETARITAWARTNTPAVGDSPGSLMFYTTPDGSDTPSARWEITSSGHLEPQTDSSYNIGTSTVRPATVYADVFVAPRVDSGATSLYLDADAGSQVYIGESADYVRPQANVLPGTDGTLVLGSSSWRWDQAWLEQYVVVENTTGVGRLYLRTQDTAVLNTGLGQIMFGGEDNTAANYDAAYIYGRAKGTWTSTSHPAEIYIVARNVSDGTEAWYFQSDGDLSAPGGSSWQGDVDLNNNDLVGVSDIFPEVAGTGSIGAWTNEFNTFYSNYHELTVRDTGSFAQMKMNRTRTSSAAVQDGDTLGRILFTGRDTTTQRDGAAITAAVDGTPGASDMPTELVFSTTPDGSATLSDRWRISAAGHLESVTVANYGIYGKPPVVSVKTATGSGTYTVPTNPKPTYIMVECQGGGGGGGGAAATGSSEAASGSGGGAGGYVRKVWSAAQLASSSYSYSVGVGGSGGSGSAGSSGGNTTFTGPTTLTASLGSGGAYGTAGAGATAQSTGSGGSASGGDLNVAGGDGGGGGRFSFSGVTSARPFTSNEGGSSVLGIGGQAPPNTTGGAGTGYGAGGSGAVNNVSQSANVGGAGTQGVIIITEFYGP